MKKTYQTPEIEILKFEVGNILLMSGEGDNERPVDPDWGSGGEDLG